LLLIFFKVNEASVLSPGDIISSITLKIAEKRKRRKQPAGKRKQKKEGILKEEKEC
jgi:hypothetical protein